MESARLSEDTCAAVRLFAAVLQMFGGGSTLWGVVHACSCFVVLLAAPVFSREQQETVNTPKGGSNRCSKLSKSITSLSSGDLVHVQ